MKVDTKALIGLVSGGLYFMSLFLGLFSVFVLQEYTAYAQGEQGCGPLLRYLDLTGDGIPDAAVLRCQFGPGGDDQAIVVDGSNDMRWDAPWQEVVDFENDTWIFDHNSDGKADLIVVYHREGSSLVADLYDDRNGDGEVGYQIVNGRVEITENKHWTIRVVAVDGWWTKGDVVNFNLRILVDGDVEGMFMMETYRRWLATDGQIDFDIQVRDLDQDGRPDYDLRTQYVPRLQGSVGLGTHMMVNWADNEVPLSGGFELWPYLNLSRTQASGSRVVKGYQNSPPPIQFDPQTGRLEAVGEFVASRGNEHNCFYYSTPRWSKEHINDSNFESPFCFYDLANDLEGVPELEVRQLYWLPNDPAFLGGQFNQPIQWIRYSWDQDNTQTWRYGLGLAGRHLVESTLTIGEYTVRTIPYSEFPYWVTEHNWDLAVFAEVTGPYWTSEGIYAVSNLEEDEFQNYLVGRSEQAPLGEIKPERGFRFERAIDFNRRPFLYFGSVDRRLHLQGVQDGVWNIDDVHAVKYESRGETGFVNSWVYLEGDRPEKWLFAMDGFLIYADRRKVILRRSRVQPSIFETLPPRNHDEWVALGQMLDMHERDFAPDDFEAMMAQFDGPTTRIQGATIRDFRPTDSGFRFVLELMPGFQIAEGEDWLGVQGLMPGEYAVTYDKDNRIFRVAPLTPARPALVPGSLRVEGEAVALHPVRIKGTLRNEGLEDVPSLPVRLHAVGPDGRDQVVGEAELALLAGEEPEVSFVWIPMKPGQWAVWLTAGDQEGDFSPSGEELAIGVKMAPQPNLRWALAGIGPVRNAWPILGLGFGLAAIAVTLSVLVSRPPHRGQTEWEQSGEKFPPRGEGNMHYVGLLTLYALGIGAYFVLRFGGNWMDVDTLRLTQSAQATLSEATAIPVGKAYPYGFTYPVMTTWIALLTGLPVLDLQTNVLPIAGFVAPALLALVLFGVALGKGKTAFLAALLLYFQADFLFVTQRGTHEKLTWPLVMLALFFLYRSMARSRQLSQFAVYVGLFYLTIYALIATNVFFASTLIAAITLSFLLGLTVNRWQARDKEQMPPGHLQRLVLISSSNVVLTYIFMFHLYKPAQQILNELPSIVDRVAVLLLSLQPTANPYAYIELGWVSRQVYLALTVFTWLLLLGSLAEWVHQGYRLLCGARLRLPEALPWLLYAGFAVQLAVAIVLDFAGVLSSNLQLRILPGLVVFAVVFLVQALQRLLRSIAWERPGYRLLSAGLTLLIAWFVFAALLKASNDPTVSNKWSFYSMAERSALQWTDTHLQYANIWIGIDERLSVMHDVLYANNPGTGNVYDVSNPEPTTRHFLLSEIERLRDARVGAVLPAGAYEDQVYDNGEAQLYRKRPQTPYQR